MSLVTGLTQLAPDKFYQSSVLNTVKCKLEPRSDSWLCSVIVRVRVVLKRTVVGDSD